MSGPCRIYSDSEIKAGLCGVSAGNGIGGTGDGVFVFRKNHVTLAGEKTEDEEAEQQTNKSPATRGISLM